MLLNFSIAAQSLCDNINFNNGDFTNWTGYTSVYARDVVGANIGNAIPYYYDEGIVPGRHTIINQNSYDPFTCGNVTTIAPGETQSVRLGNGGIGAWGNGVRWQRDYLEYTISVTPSNALLIYKYAVVLQDPNSDPGIAPHDDPIKPRFVVSIKDQGGALIDPNCGVFSVTADENVDGFRNCTQANAQANGGQFASNGSTIYRAWTTVGVDLRNFIGTDVTILFETWDCGLGGHFGYAYLNAKCDSLGVKTENCSAQGGVNLTAPDGFSYQWSTGQSTQTINIPNAVAGDTVWVDLTTKSGCTSSLYTVLNPAEISANVIPSKNIICSGESINFKDASFSRTLLDNSPITITSKDLRFSDGQVYNNFEEIDRIFNNPGVYTATLSVENDLGCIDSTQISFEVKPIPVPEFNFTPNCVGGQIDFESTALIASGTITDFDWNIGDATTATGNSTQHTYGENEIKEAQLVVTSNFGCIDSIRKNIAFWPNPTPDFSANPACAGTPVEFLNTSTTEINDPIASFKWNFNDNTQESTLESPKHSYNNSGVYSPKLTVTTQRGCKADTTFDVTVYPNPTVDFEFGRACLNEIMQLDNTTPDINSITNWSWDLGDGTTSNAEAPVHTYTTSDVFEVSLRGETALGCTDSVSKFLQIATVPAVNFSATEVCIGQPTVFRDLSINSAPDNSTWEWKKADFVFDSIQNPTYIFDSAGTINIQLNVVSGQGCSDSTTLPITIKEGPLADFTADTICFGDLLNFTNLTSSTLPDPIRYSWNFGDGSPNNILFQPAYKYFSADTFSVTLNATQKSCSNSITKDVLVKKVPVIDFTAEPVCQGLLNKFTNLTVFDEPIQTWSWFIEENNQNYAGLEPDFFINNTDTITVSLKATGENGCSDSLLKFLPVNPSPIIDFAFESDCEGEPIVLRSLSTVAKGNITSWEWTLPQGKIESGNLIESVFDTSGTLNVQLKAVTNKGCADSLTLPVSIYDKPIAMFNAQNTCIGNSIVFNDSSTTLNDQIINYTWDVGDGSLLKTQPILTHNYPASNTYLATLMVETDKGCTDTTTQEVTVFDLPQPDFSFPSVCFNTPTQFKNETADTAKIVEYDWDFKNGNQSNTFEPSIAFSNTGELQITLQVTDSNGCKNSIDKTIFVKPLPNPVFDADKYNGCDPQTIRFVDLSNAPLDTLESWSWDFGDGDTTSKRLPTHTFNQPGYYDISLTVTTINGCQNTNTIDSMIHIYPVPQAGFDFTPKETDVLNSKISFFDESVDADLFRWEFGDNQVSSDQNPSNTYVDAGEYRITQFVSTNFGCKDSMSKPVLIEPVFKVVAANAFTPNSDGLNDEFKPAGLGVDPAPSRYTFMIFNRWGEMIFKTNDVNEGWDGKVNTFEFLNTTKVQQVDVYVWKVEVYDITSVPKKHTFVGTVALLK